MQREKLWPSSSKLNRNSHHRSQIFHVTRLIDRHNYTIFAIQKPIFFTWSISQENFWEVDSQAAGSYMSRTCLLLFRILSYLLRQNKLYCFQQAVIDICCTHWCVRVHQMGIISQGRHCVLGPVCLVQTQKKKIALESY